METWSDCRAATLISDRSEVYRGCHRLFPRGNRSFQVRNVSPMEGKSEGRQEGASPQFSNSFRVRRERKVGRSRGKSCGTF